MDSKTIHNALDLIPIEHSRAQGVIPNSSVDDNGDITNDFKYARENLYSVIEQGNHALEQMLDVARASEHPRAYEVVSTLMTTLVNANKDLLDLSKKKKELITKDLLDPKTVNNNLFVGSTADIQKILRDMSDE
jgi:hypothetical protein